MRFYLGTHEQSWLYRTSVPLFLSHRRLTRLRSLYRARGQWALDSGGFTELSMFGRWCTEPVEYIDAVYRYRDEIGNLVWASPQDWMCEPDIIEGTGLSVAEHQDRTVENYLLLRDKAPDLPFVPVLQGWLTEDYHAHVESYRSAGVDLVTLPLVGVGSVCRRQGEESIATIFATLAERGLALHGFGLKTKGLRLSAQHLVSADSLAWSFRARSAARHGEPRDPRCAHKTCANCLRFALGWRSKLLCSL